MSIRSLPPTRRRPIGRRRRVPRGARAIHRSRPSRARSAMIATNLRGNTNGEFANGADFGAERASFIPRARSLARRARRVSLGVSSRIWLKTGWPVAPSTMCIVNCPSRTRTWTHSPASAFANRPPPPRRETNFANRVKEDEHRASTSSASREWSPRRKARGDAVIVEPFISRERRALMSVGPITPRLRRRHTTAGPMVELEDLLPQLGLALLARARSGAAPPARTTRSMPPLDVDHRDHVRAFFGEPLLSTGSSSPPTWAGRGAMRRLLPSPGGLLFPAHGGGAGRACGPTTSSSGLW